MSIQDQASYIIVLSAYAITGYVLLGLIVNVAEAVSRVRKRRQRDRMHKRFVAARVAAREATEAKMRAEGYWDNYEIQAAMDRAGRQAAPGYRP